MIVSELKKLLDFLDVQAHVILLSILSVIMGFYFAYNHSKI